MGFEAPRTVFGLTFEDPKYAGLEVRVRSLPVGDFEVVAGIEPLGPDATNAAALVRLQEALRLLAANLESWNLEQGGEPVPADYGGICAQEPGFLMDVLAAWGDAMASVPPPLPEGSPNGGTPATSAAAEESLGLATSSTSLPS